MWGIVFKKLICFFALMAFVATSVVPPSYAQSVMDLPQAGSLVNLSQGFAPVVLRGMKVDTRDPFRFEFLVDSGDSGFQGDVLKDESTKLIRYFLASVTTPEKDLWVNLSPYEQDRIIPEAFGVTEMGRDLLSQDYILKQITSSLMYPENEPGKTFWEKIYAKAYETYGTTDVPLDTFNKVWITPDVAEVYEDKGVAFIGESRLKVMLESDYLASNAQKAEGAASSEASANELGTSEMTRNIIRDVMIPVLEKEVNEGRNFSQLRQVYHSLILAAWYKKRLKESIFSQVYMDQNKVAGVDIQDKQMGKKIWAQYVESFKKGAYNYIKEEYDAYSQELIPRKYFAGGFNGAVTEDLELKPTSLLQKLPKWQELLKNSRRSLMGFTAGALMLASVVVGSFNANAQNNSTISVNQPLPRAVKPEVPAAQAARQDSTVSAADAQIDVQKIADRFPNIINAFKGLNIKCAVGDLQNNRFTVLKDANGVIKAYTTIVKIYSSDGTETGAFQVKLNKKTEQVDVALIKDAFKYRIPEGSSDEIKNFVRGKILLPADKEPFLAPLLEDPKAELAGFEYDQTDINNAINNNKDIGKPFDIRVKLKLNGNLVTVAKGRFYKDEGGVLKVLWELNTKQGVIQYGGQKKGPSVVYQYVKGVGKVALGTLAVAGSIGLAPVTEGALVGASLDLIEEGGRKFVKLAPAESHYGDVAPHILTENLSEAIASTCFTGEKHQQIGRKVQLEGSDFYASVFTNLLPVVSGFAEDENKDESFFGKIK